MRTAGLRVTLYPEADKFAKQLKYADAIKVPFVCVLGESEIAESKATLKDMQSGEQIKLTSVDIAARIKKAADSSKPGAIS